MPAKITKPLIYQGRTAQPRWTYPYFTSSASSLTYWWMPAHPNTLAPTASTTLKPYTTVGRINTTSLKSEDISSPKTQNQAIGPDMDSTTTPKRFTFVWFKSAAIVLLMLVALLLWAILLTGGMCTRFYKRIKKSFVR